MEKKQCEMLQKILRELRGMALALNGCMESIAGMLYAAESEGCDLERDCEACYYYYRGECALCGRSAASGRNEHGGI